MPDESYLDAKYFIDETVFNCPYCNRRNVAYTLDWPESFDWSPTKTCYVYFAKCHSCENKSMHLSFTQIQVYNDYGERYRFKSAQSKNLDGKFFYSVPTSFFALDARIPSVLRELITEAEGCLKSNFLTGASACARKLIYELARLEGAKGAKYGERIKSLKEIRSDVEGDYFDALLAIQQVTSDKVHEESYDGWDAKHLRLILSTLVEILGVMYVIPAVRKERQKSISALRTEVLGGKSKDA